MYNKIKCFQDDCREVYRSYTDSSLDVLRGSHLAITGGSGFVGSWVSEMVSLLNDEFKFDMRLTLLVRDGEKFQQEKAHLSKRADIKLQQVDVRDSFEVGHDVNYLIHAASTPSGQAEASRPFDSMRIIADGTANALEAVENCSDFRLFVNLSSAFCAHEAQNSYVMAKRYGEVLVSAARSQKRLPTINVRPYAFIGPYLSLKAPFALNNFIRDALQQSSIRILGDGRSIRSYLYGADAAMWLLRLLALGESSKTYSLGSSKGVYLSALAEEVASNFSPVPDIQLQRQQSFLRGVEELVADTTQIEKEIGVKEVISLQASVKKTINWWQHGK